MISLGSLRFRWVSLDIRGSDPCLVHVEVISYINEHQMKSTGQLLENHVLPELKKDWKKEWKWGEGKRGKKILFPNYFFFQKWFFCFLNKLHKYVTHGRYCNRHATMRARQKEIYSLLWHQLAGGRKANPAWLWLLCISPSWWIDSRIVKQLLLPWGCSRLPPQSLSQAAI